MKYKRFFSLILAAAVIIPAAAAASTFYQLVEIPGGGILCRSGDVMIGGSTDDTQRMKIYCDSFANLGVPSVSLTGDVYRTHGTPSAGSLCRTGDVLVGASTDGTNLIKAYCQSVDSPSGSGQEIIGAWTQRVGTPSAGTLCPNGEVAVGAATDDTNKVWLYCSPVNVSALSPSTAPAPTCSVTFDQNPLTGGSTTMRWSSSDASLFYINGVGYVAASGSAKVYNPGDYSGYVSGSGGNGNCRAVLSGANQCVPVTYSSGSGPSSGQSSGAGAAGSRTFSSPGTYSFAVPNYGTLTVEVKGAGGGGGGGGQVPTAQENDTAACAGSFGYGKDGHVGGESSFGSVVARGGVGGPGGPTTYPVPSGADGTASGGGQNITGGGAPGGTGGQAGYSIGPCTGDPDGGDGGKGGKAVKTYAAGELSGTISVKVGGGGAGGERGYYTDNNQYPAGENYNHPLPGNPGEAGGNGSVVITWTAPAGGGSAGSGGAGSGGTGGGSVVYTCGPDGNLRDSCGNVTACAKGCSPLSNTCKKTASLCVEYRVCDTSGKKVVNSCTGTVLETCPSGSSWMCQEGRCVRPQIAFSAFDGLFGGSRFRATGHLQARPTLLRPGQTTRLYWNVINAASCSVVGTNGDGVKGASTGAWTAMFSGESGKESSPITSKTVYTLQCQSFPGVTPSFIEEKATINVLPLFQES